MAVFRKYRIFHRLTPIRDSLMARRKRRGMRKMQPAVLQLQYEVAPNVSRFIDIRFLIYLV